jgi:exodeoxyribonuclease V alpha subunit
MSVLEVDPFDARRALDAPPLLRAFNDAGVLAAADVHVARRLAVLGGERDAAVALAVALAVRGPRLGHVYVDLATVRDTVTVEEDGEGAPAPRAGGDEPRPVDLAELPWPPTDDWLRRLAASPLVAVGEDGAAERPLRLIGAALYLDRYWREEREVAADLARLATGGAQADDALLAAGLERMFAGRRDDRQALACAAAVLRRFAVIAGGPGTGKTTTVARVVALLLEQAAAAGRPAPLVALAAPTGKAAARLEEAVHDEAAALDVAPEVRDALLALQASTLHRLLGWRPDSRSRFRHHRGNRLPHDVVVVDETSMVSLSLMARLAEAVRADARLVLVGDPGQLSSIEAGAVLGDVVGPASEGLLLSAGARSRLAAVSGIDVAASQPPPGTVVGDGIVVLDRVHRFGSGIGALAEAVRRGDPDAVVEALAGAPEGVTWIARDAATADAAALAAVWDGAVATGRRVVEAARAGDAARALDALGAFRVLCAHRAGSHGVATWAELIERRLANEIPGLGAEGVWYVGRPLLVTENDYALRLYNGDTGVVIADERGRVTAAFERGGEVVELSPARLGAVETVHAMTVHKSQGSQFDTAAVLLPDPGSHILTRELLYTAVTRARTRLLLVGTEQAVRAAVARPVTRASGLRWRLWGDGSP